MSTLSALPNVGPVLEDHLLAVGIDSPQALRKVGSREAFIRIRLHRDSGACLNMLRGLEGAVQGIRHSHLSEETGRQLANFYHTL